MRSLQTILEASLRRFQSRKFIRYIADGNVTVVMCKARTSYLLFVSKKCTMWRDLLRQLLQGIGEEESKQEEGRG